MKRFMNRIIIRLIVSLILLFCSILFGQYTNIQVNYPGSIDPQEVTIAINPANPLNLAAGANLDYYYYSKDGGLTWTEGRLISTFGVYGDPSVTFDHLGNLYFGHLSNTPFGYWIDRIVIQKSTNGGETWSAGAGIGFNPPRVQDKEWLIADHTDSPYRGNIYVSWTEFDGYKSYSTEDSTRIRLSRSTDQGGTWSVPVRLSDHGGDCLDGDNTVEGAVPAVGPNGEVYVAWSGPLGIMFDKSTDGGVTFGKDIYVGPHPGGWNIFVWGLNRCNGLPITACDISDSPYRGNIYVLWSDQRNGALDTDVFIIKSTDGGETWGDERRVNNDNTEKHQFFPWISVDPITGVIWVIFYDRRDTVGEATDVTVARSTDGGDTFTNFKVSESSFTPVFSVFFGDYINIAAYDGKIYPIWGRMENYELSVWTALIEDTISVHVAEDRIARTFQLAQNYPNPFNGVTHITYSLQQPSNVHLAVYNSTGQLIETLEDDYQSAGSHSVVWNPDGLSSGIYYYQIRTEKQSAIRKCLYLK
ncbi:T9SS type A sorting domain-containing protein [bacterium]